MGDLTVLSPAGGGRPRGGRRRSGRAGQGEAVLAWVGGGVPVTESLLGLQEVTVGDQSGWLGVP